MENKCLNEPTVKELNILVDKINNSTTHGISELFADNSIKKLIVKAIKFWADTKAEKWPIYCLDTPDKPQKK